MDLWPWFLFGGAIIAIISWVRSDENRSSWSYVGAVGVVLAFLGLLMLGHEADKPITSEWRVDQLQEINTQDGYRVLIINSHDVGGNIQTQYRQMNPPPELVLLFQRLTKHPEVRSLVSVRCGQNGCAIPKVDVLFDRFSLPETHHFR